MRMTRRYAILGLGAVALSGKARAATVSRPGTAFGTTVKLSISAPTAEIAEACLAAGFAEIRRCEAAFNLFEDRKSVV